MGFLGISGKTWKKVGKIALKVAPIVAAPFTGGVSLLALGAGTGAISGALDGGGWKGALMGGAMGAIPGGGGAGAAAGSAAKGVAKAGLKEIAKGIGKGAATNFVTGVGTALATGQNPKQALASGGQSALSGAGSAGPTGGLKNIATTVGKNIATNTGANYAARGLTKAGVPGSIAAQGGNVFTQYLGNQFNTPTAAERGTGGGGGGQPVATTKPGISSYLPTDWKQQIGQAGLTAATNLATRGGGGGGQTGGGTSPTYPDRTAPTPPGGWGTPSTNLPTGGGSIPGGSVNPGQPPAKPPLDPNRPPTWAERVGPIATQVGGMVLGGYVGKKAQESAAKRSPEEQAALTGATGAANQAGQLGGELAQEGRDYQRKPGQYFQTLLSGDRAAMSQAIAGPAAQITGNYRGAERALDQQGVRGAARDVAVGDLNRDRVSKIASLTTGMQPYAAEQLAKMGSDTLSQAPGLLNTSGNLYSGLLGEGYKNRVYSRQEGATTAGAIGGLARDVGEVVFKRPQAPATPVPPTVQTGGRVGGVKETPQGGTATPPPVTGQTTAPAPAVTPGAPPVQGGTLRGPSPTVSFGGVPAPKVRNPYNIDFGAKAY